MEQRTHTVKLLGLVSARIARKPVRRSRARTPRRLVSMGMSVSISPTASKRRPSRAIRADGSGPSISGKREQEWIESHWREYAGRWVALDGSRLLAADASAREALEKARALGASSPFLVHVTEPSDLPFGGW